MRPQLAVSRMSSFKKLVICFVALGGAGVVGFFALAWRPAIAPILASARQTFAPELIVKGEALAGGGYCAECHTAKGGKVSLSIGARIWLGLTCDQVC